MRKIIILAVCLLSAAGPVARSQEFSLSSNILDLANFGTLNMQAGLSFSRHVSVHAGGRYNNWNFGSLDKGTAIQNRARSIYAGTRYWPWNVYSSWWMGAKLQLEEYNRGGFFKKTETEEGIAAGLGLGFGYSRMLSNHWNLDLGLGFWTGKAWYTRYRCTVCGRVLTFDDGSPVRNAEKWFLLPSNDIQVSLTYVF